MYQGKYVNKEAPKRPTVSADTSVETPELPQKEPPAKKTRKKSSKGTVIFYSIYGAFVVIAVIAICCLLIPLRSWLVRYEESQPEKMCQAVYDTFFSQPDWGVLYELAEEEDTAFEDKQTYITYMTQKVENASDPTLTYTETSAGLSGDHKYIIKLDEEKIATFTLTEGTPTEDDITTWELGVIELFFTREHSVTIEKLPEYTVYINGVALDDSYTVRTVCTKAEQYLPEGTHGYRMEQQYVCDLLMAPEIVVLDADGNPITMLTDSQTGILTPELPASEAITREETDIAVAAAKAYSKFAIRSISTSELRKYIDPNSQIYTDVVETAAFLQSYNGYDFSDDITVTDFCRYSDTVFSARVIMTMNVYASFGNTKVFEMDSTFFFTLNNAGNYLVTDMTNMSVLEQVEEVRLTFLNGTETVDSFMVSASASSVMLPQVTVPEGKVLKGWAVQTVEENGSITMTILLIPGADGAAQVPSGQILEPSVLYAVFENEVQ